VALSWLILAPVTVLPTIIKVCRAIECGVGEYLGSLLPACVGSGVMLAAILGLRAWMSPHGWPGLISEVALGGAVYCAALRVFYFDRVMRFVRFLRDLRGSRTAAV
jgi:hypothetical protein